jgi:hypothetical protein
MQTVATANVNDDADSTKHVNIGLQLFKDARPLPPMLQSSCLKSLPRACKKAVYDSKRLKKTGQRQQKLWRVRRHRPKPVVERYARQIRSFDSEGVEEHRKRSAYNEESEISSDGDDIKGQMRKSVLPRAPSGNISKADKLRQAGLRKKETYRSPLSARSVRNAVLEEPELEPDAATHVRVSATHALSTPPPTPQLGDAVHV